MSPSSPKTRSSPPLTISQQLNILQLIFDHIDNGACVTDPDGYITHFNRPYGQFLGIDPKEQIGKHITEVVENSRMHIVAQTGIAEINEPHSIRGQEMIVQRIPIKEDGRVIAVFGQVMFKDVKEVSNLAGRLSLLQTTVAKYQKELNELARARYTFDSIVGTSHNLHLPIREAKKSAATHLPVLITGESGTGKELFAQAIHNYSQRSRGPFIRLNCAAIPPDLMESELFGYERGAFTGASRSGKPGKFELAQGGTIFLDEVGELPLEMQPKLLRVLEEKEVERIGGNRVIPVDFRLVAASNRNLQRMVNEKTFRSDLFYRLNVMALEIPPLRERREDIGLLADHFLSLASQDSGPVRLSPEARAILEEHDWPGNVRELHNVIERLVAIHPRGVINTSDLPISLHRSTPIPRKLSGGEGGSDPSGYPPRPPSLLKEVVAKAERQAILEALQSCQYNKARAATILGIHRTLLYKKLRKYGIELTP